MTPSKTWSGDGFPTLPVQVAPPDFAVSGLLPHAVADADVVALPVLPGAGDGATPLLGPGADALEAALGTDLLGVLEVDRAVGNTGEVVQLATPAGIPGNPKLRLVLLVGVGDQRPTDFRRAGAAVARAARDRGTLATSIPALDPTAGLEAFVVGATLGSFGFHWRSSEPEHRPVGRVVLADLDAGDDQELVRRAVALGGAGWLARMLATVPSNLKTPAWLAEQAERIAADHDLKCGCGTRSSSPPTGSAASSASDAARPTRPGWSGSTTPPRKPGAAPRPSYSSARGSPSTAAA